MRHRGIHLSIAPLASNVKAAANNPTFLLTRTLIDLGRIDYAIDSRSQCGNDSRIA
jgi:hypothetical protein